MRKLRIAFASAILATLALVSFGASPALACDAGQVCLYKHSNLNGPKAVFNWHDKNYTNNNFGGCSWWGCGLNDRTSSIKNRGNVMNTRHYVHINYGGNNFKLNRGFWRNMDNNFNDELSSHKWVN